MKYVRKVKGGFLFDPPSEAIKAGITQRKFYEDGRSYRYEVPKQLSIIEAWRKGEVAPEVLNPNSTILQAIAFYRSTRSYQNLKASSKNSYDNCLNKAYKTSAFRYGKLRIKELDVKVCRNAYGQWVEDSVYSANRNRVIFGILFTFLCSLDLLDKNPMALVKSERHEPETSVWSKKEIDTFFSVAFTRYEWRNVALIVYLCYEWGQRPIDIQQLQWSNLDFDTNICTLTQSKRGATVYLPISEEMREMLIEQKELFDFQQYIAPRLRVQDNAYRPYTSSSMGEIFREIKKEAGLGDHLKVGALRKTAINEARDAGVDVAGIQQFSGHKNLSSLNPYMKFTPTGAKNALDRRRTSVSTFPENPSS